jgi:inorganic pyrophosphatase
MVFSLLLRFNNGFMDVANIPAFHHECIHVIIETPRFSRVKYSYDPKFKIIKFEKELPEGFSFPFDFGFIPNTKGGDGDPLDVLVLMNKSAEPGCLIECRVIGAILGNVREDGKKFRNDRILAVPAYEEAYDRIQSIKDLKPHSVTQIENFFISYNRGKGKAFIPVDRVGKTAAMELIRKSTRHKNAA